MKQNIEFKAYFNKDRDVEALCESIGAGLIRSHTQTDVYFQVREGRLKLRRSSLKGDSLIYYKRLDSPSARESNYGILPLEDKGDVMLSFMEKSIGTRAVVEKKRDTYQLRSSIINFDDVKDAGSFVEVETDVDKAGSAEKAAEEAEELKNLLGVKPADVLPWSYCELTAMRRMAAQYRERLKNAKGAGTLFLLDGASCSGKTTLTHWLIEEAGLDLKLVPRYCTREPRENEKTESEYIFVSHEVFKDMAGQGAFIEYRDFEFGMSYGLPWKQTMEYLEKGISCVAIINLGNIQHVKKNFPEAVTILLNSSEETIRCRLHKRGKNKEHEIEERLDNARKVVSYKEFYDHVVRNDEGKLEKAKEDLRKIIVGAGD